MKILIADDSAFMRSVLKNILMKNGWSGWDLLEAQDGQQAVEIIQTQHPDLVLLDIVMPNKDGLEVLKEVGKQANIIVISAVGQEQIVEEAKQLGAKDFIVKPFDFNEVVAAVKQYTSSESTST